MTRRALFQLLAAAFAARTLPSAAAAAQLLPAVVPLPRRSRNRFMRRGEWEAYALDVLNKTRDEWMPKAGTIVTVRRPRRFLTLPSSGADS